MDLSHLRTVTKQHHTLLSQICSDQAIHTFMKWRYPLISKKQLLDPKLLISEKIFMIVYDSRKYADKNLHFELVVYLLHNGGDL